MIKRVLVTEEISDTGLNRLRQAGFDVDVQLGMSEQQFHQVLPGVSALIVRSATQVDVAALDAGRDLVVVGRAGVGLDNIDVEAATARGVMVVNAPESNVLSAAEHTMGLMLAMARNIPQAHAALKSGRWERSRWEGIELAGKTLGIIGLGRIGKLVACRALAFDMRLIGYDPYISEERARQLNVELMPLDQVVGQADILTVHLPKNRETTGLINSEVLRFAKPTLRIINVARGGIVDEADLFVALRDGQVAGAALDVFSSEPMTSSPLFGLDRVVVTPHLGASTREAQDKAGNAVADMVQLALNGEFVPFAVNVAASATNTMLKPFVPLAERLGRVFASLIDEIPADFEVVISGEIGAYDSRIITLSALKGLLSVLSAEKVSFVNAPLIAKNLGIAVREAATPTTTHNDYVNLITLSAGARNVSATLAGRRREARIVTVDDHLTDIPPSEYMLVVKNDDRPGVIGNVATALGNANINISNMDVGKTEQQGSALMLIATSSPVPDDLIAELRTMPGIVSVATIRG